MKRIIIQLLYLILSTIESEDEKSPNLPEYPPFPKIANDSGINSNPIEPIPCNLDWWEIMGIPRPINNLTAIRNARLVETWTKYNPIPLLYMDPNSYNYYFKVHAIPQFSQHSQVVLRMLAESDLLS